MTLLHLCLNGQDYFNRGIVASTWPCLDLEMTSQYLKKKLSCAKFYAKPPLVMVLEH